MNHQGSAPFHCGPLQKRPCDFAPWGEWGECSATCDGGMRERSRHIKTPNSNDGAGLAGVGQGLLSRCYSDVLYMNQGNQGSLVCLRKWNLGCPALLRKTHHTAGGTLRWPRGADSRRRPKRRPESRVKHHATKNIHCQNAWKLKPGLIPMQCCFWC